MPNKKGLKNRPVFIGGEGGIRTHVDANRNQEVAENVRFAVPWNALASPLLAVDLAVDLFHGPPNR